MEQIDCELWPKTKKEIATIEDNNISYSLSLSFFVLFCRAAFTRTKAALKLAANTLCAVGHRSATHHGYLIFTINHNQSISIIEDCICYIIYIPFPDVVQFESNR